MFRLKADSAKAVDQFVERVVASGKVWILDDEDYVAGCASHEHEDQFVYPLFSDGAYAKRGAACWDDMYPPQEVDLSILLERLLPQYIEDGDYVGPNWDAHMAGAEVAAQELLDRLNAGLATVKG